MTNEQKAKELAINVMANRHFESNGVCQRKQIENALKEIADWKDEQLRQRLKDMYKQNLNTIGAWKIESIYFELFGEPIDK